MADAMVVKHVGCSLQQPFAYYILSGISIHSVGGFTMVLPSFYHVKITDIKKTTVTGWF
ncbi:TPA: hypothetical protein ACGD8A_004808 [Serratia marcescens]